MAKKMKPATVEDLSEPALPRSALASPPKQYREVVLRQGDVVRKPNIREMLAEAPIPQVIREPDCDMPEYARKLLRQLEKIIAAKVYTRLSPVQACGIEGAAFFLRECLDLENDKPMVVAIQSLLGGVSASETSERVTERMLSISSARDRRNSWQTIDHKQRYFINGGLKALQEVSGVKVNDRRVSLKDYLAIDLATGHGMGNSGAV